MIKDYEVIDSVELSEVDRVKGIVKKRRYTLRTKLGSIITVDLYEKDWSAEKAAAIFLKAAQEEDKIRSL